VTKLTPDRSRQWPVSDPDSVPTWAYTAQIRILEKEVVIYEEAKTFSRKGAAEKWARARQVALEDPATLAQARVGATGLVFCPKADSGAEMNVVTTNTAMSTRV